MRRCGAQRTGPVRNGMLFFGGHLSECAAVELQRGKHGVIAKAVRSAWTIGDDTFNLAPKGLGRTIGPDDTYRCDEARTSLIRRRLGELSDQLFAVLGIRGVGSREPGGEHAGSSIESVDFEAGVISDSTSAGCVGNGARFEFGVGLKCRTGLLDIGNVRGPSRYVNSCAGQDVDHLSGLIGIGCRKKKSHRHRPDFGSVTSGNAPGGDASTSLWA